MISAEGELVQFSNRVIPSKARVSLRNKDIVYDKEMPIQYNSYQVLILGLFLFIANPLYHTHKLLLRCCN